MAIVVEVAVVPWHLAAADGPALTVAAPDPAPAWACTTSQ